jgi:DNA-3-methyladenine glycosylase I
VTHIRVHSDGKARCSWVTDDEIYIRYHDTEWGQEGRGQRELFEAICLEGFQAGLSWITILKRREGFRRAFENFDIEKVAKFDANKIEELMLNPEIIRNRAKIISAIDNANLVLEKNIDLTSLIWSFAPANRQTSEANFTWVATSEESVALSKALRKLGFSFVGPTTMYALMQSSGLVKDHAPGCFRRD